MTPLPNPFVLASLVSHVTGTMLGISFVPDDPEQGGDDLHWKTALLPIRGDRPVTVGLSSDRNGCEALSAAMFSVPPEAVDPDMIDDSLRELLNMTAGLLKTNLQLDQALGLPLVLIGSQPPILATPPQGQTVVLRATGLGLVLWVAEGIIAPLQ